MKKGLFVTGLVAVVLAGLLYWTPAGSQVTAFVNAIATLNSATNTNPSLVATGSDTNIGIILQVKGTSTIQFKSATSGTTIHTEYSGTIPTLTSCGGGSPALAAGSNDSVGNITLGSATAACTLNFATAYTNIPFCFAIEETTASQVPLIPTAGRFTTSVRFTGLTSLDVIDYFCVGRF